MRGSYLPVFATARFYQTPNNICPSYSSSSAACALITLLRRIGLVSASSRPRHSGPGTYADGVIGILYTAWLKGRMALCIDRHELWQNRHHQSSFTKRLRFISERQDRLAVLSRYLPRG